MTRKKSAEAFELPEKEVETVQQEEQLDVESTPLQSEAETNPNAVTVQAFAHVYQHKLEERKAVQDKRDKQRALYQQIMESRRLGQLRRGEELS